MELRSQTPNDVNQGVSDKYIFRWIVPLALNLFGRWISGRGTRVRTTKHFVLKYDHSLSMAEAHAIDYVAEHTSIPVPRVISAFRARDGIGYILMKRCPGTPLLGRFKDFSPEERCTVVLQLRAIADELRALKPDRPGHVGRFGYIAFNDERVHLSSQSPGPFESVEAFHLALKDGLTRPSGHEQLDSLIAAQDSRAYDVHLSHTDFTSRNILYANGKIIAIVDWEGAGWLPDYWEYTMAMDSAWDDPEFRDHIHEWLDAYPQEWATQKTRWRLFGRPGWF